MQSVEKNAGKGRGEEEIGGWTKRQRGEDQHAGIKERREGSK